MSDRFRHARNLLRTAVGARAFPAAVVEVGTATEVLWREPFGALTYEPDAPLATDRTIFDLASLTKVIATGALAMRLVDQGRLRLNDPVARWLPAWRGVDREEVTIRDLLAHAAGLTSWLPFYMDHIGRQDFERAICTLALEYRPRTQSEYSDLGFILLGFIIADAGGGPLARQFSDLFSAIVPASDALTFNPPHAWRAGTAPTEVDAWRGRLLVGEVHDENAWALGGAAGHAGLFGTVAAVGRFAQVLLGTLGGVHRASPWRSETVRTFLARAGDPGSSRALAWDTMLPTSSCGTRMSAEAAGHTGFTGTSLWIDPAADVYVTLLTNRVHPSRENDAILRVRPMLHDAVMEALDRLGSTNGSHRR